jgi:hypothetical protein
VEIEPAGVGLAIRGVALVEAGVEVAERRAGKGDPAALESVGFDVTAEVDVHDVSPLRDPPPPWGVVVGSRMDAILSEIEAANYKHLNWLRVNIRKQTRTSPKMSWDLLLVSSTILSITD